MKRIAEPAPPLFFCKPLRLPRAARATHAQDAMIRRGLREKASARDGSAIAD
jgi:hypothetical protein